MKQIYYGWWIVLASFVVAFYVAGTIFYGFTAYIEPLADEFGWSYTQISLAASLRGLNMGLLAPLVGILVDRFGSRKLLFSGVLVLGLGNILLGFTQSLAMFYGAFILIAFGAGGCTSVVTMTAVANWFDKNVGKAMGLTGSGFGASGLIIPLIVWMIAAFGWRTTMIISGIGMWVIGIPAAFVLRNMPEDNERRPPDSESDESRRLSRRQTHVKGFRYRSIISEKPFLFVSLAEMIRLIALMAVVTHIMPYLSTLEISRTSAGLTAAAIPVLSITGRFGFGWLGDIFEKKYIMAISYGLMGLGMLALCYVQFTGVIYVFLFFFSNGFGGITVLRGAILREYYGKYNFGKLLGIMMGFAACGGIIGPTAAGWVFDRMGSYYFVWLTFSVLIGLAIILILRIESKENMKNILILFLAILTIVGLPRFAPAQDSAIYSENLQNKIIAPWLVLLLTGNSSDVGFGSNCGVMGDSIGSATHTDDSCDRSAGDHRELMDCLELRLGSHDIDWSFTGGTKSWSIANRLGCKEVYNTSKDGEEWKDAFDQARDQIENGPVGKVIVHLGANDVCAEYSHDFGSLAFVQPTTPANLVSIEAEHFIQRSTGSAHQWEPDHTPGASISAVRAIPINGTAISFPGYLSDSPRLDFRVHFVKTGVHHLWIRGYASGTGEDLVHIGLDGQRQENAENIKIEQYDDWIWSNSTQTGYEAFINVDSVGEHTINVYMGKDGLRLDKIVLSPDPAYQPSDFGPEEQWENDLGRIAGHIDDTMMYLTENLPAGGEIYWSGIIDLKKFRDMMVDRQHDHAFQRCHHLWDMDIREGALQGDAKNSLCIGELGYICNWLPDWLEDELLGIYLDQFKDDFEDSRPCGRILDSRNTQASLDEARRFNKALNDLMEQKAAQYRGRKRVDINFTQKLWYSADEYAPYFVSRLDCYHPNRPGQLKLAQLVWQGHNPDYKPTGAFYFEGFDSEDWCAQEFTQWDSCWYEGGWGECGDEFICNNDASGWFKFGKETSNNEDHWITRDIWDLSDKEHVWLYFKHKRDGFDDDRMDWVAFYVWDGFAWIQLEKFKKNNDAGNHCSAYYDLTPYKEAEPLKIRFQTNNSSDMKNGDKLMLDDVSVFAW